MTEEKKLTLADLLKIAMYFKVAPELLTVTDSMGRIEVTFTLVDSTMTLDALGLLRQIEAE